MHNQIDKRKGILDMNWAAAPPPTTASLNSLAPPSTTPTIVTPATTNGVPADSPTKLPSSRLIRDIKRRPSMAPEVDPSRQVENLRSQVGLLAKDKTALEKEKKELEHDLDRLLGDKLRLQQQKKNITSLIGLIGGEVTNLSQVPSVITNLETTLGAERFAKLIKLCATSPPSTWRRHTANRRRRRSRSCPPAL